jgi:hypothetical protein
MKSALREIFCLLFAFLALFRGYSSLRICVRVSSRLFAACRAEALRRRVHSRLFFASFVPSAFAKRLD